MCACVSARVGLHVCLCYCQGGSIYVPVLVSGWVYMCTCVSVSVGLHVCLC